MMLIEVGDSDMSRYRFQIRWFALGALTIGMMFQTTSATCASLSASAGANLTTSIVNQVIRSNVSQLFGLGATSTSLTSALTGMGT
jgi:hypothetical protein